MAAVKQWPFPANVRDEVAFVMGIARHKLVDEYRRQDSQVRRRQQFAASSGHAAAHRTTAAAKSGSIGRWPRCRPSNEPPWCFATLTTSPSRMWPGALGKSVRATESLLARGTKALRKSFREVEKTDV